MTFAPARPIAALWPLIAFRESAAPVVPAIEQLSADCAAISLLRLHDCASACFA